MRTLENEAALTGKILNNGVIYTPALPKISIPLTRPKIIYLRRGSLIVCEGISGSGKSENVRRICEYLKSIQMKYIRFEWNSNKIVRRIIYTLERIHLLNSNLYSMLQWFSFMFDYYFIISKALRKNYVVVADRYIYTAITRDRVNKACDLISRFFYRFFRKPDIIFFHNTNPLICEKRIRERNKKLFHTNRSIQKDPDIVNKNYYYLQQLHNVYEELIHHLKQKEQRTNILLVNDESLFICKRGICNE